MIDVETALYNILHAVYGEEVRQSLHDGLYEVNQNSLEAVAKAIKDLYEKSDEQQTEIDDLKNTVSKQRAEIDELKEQMNVAQSQQQDIDMIKKQLKTNSEV